MAEMTENIILESYDEVELLVTYSYEEVRQIEEGHGFHDLSYTDVNVTFVELVIGGESVKMEGKANLLPHLNPRQLSKIIGQLSIY
jgi:hypothetical protein